MTSGAENVILEILKRIQACLDLLLADLADVKVRVSAPKTMQGGQAIQIGAQGPDGSLRREARARRTPAGIRRRMNLGAEALTRRPT